MYIYCSLQSRRLKILHSKLDRFEIEVSVCYFHIHVKINDILQWFRLKRCFLCHLAILKTRNHNKIDLIIIFIIPAKKNVHTPTNHNQASCRIRKSVFKFYYFHFIWICKMVCEKLKWFPWKQKIKIEKSIAYIYERTERLLFSK